MVWLVRAPPLALGRLTCCSHRALALLLSVLLCPLSCGRRPAGYPHPGLDRPSIFILTPTRDKSIPFLLPIPGDAEVTAVREPGTVSVAGLCAAPSLSAQTGRWAAALWRAGCWQVAPGGSGAVKGAWGRVLAFSSCSPRSLMAPGLPHQPAVSPAKVVLFPAPDAAPTGTGLRRAEGQRPALRGTRSFRWQEDKEPSRRAQGRVQVAGWRAECRQVERGFLAGPAWEAAGVSWTRPQAGGARALPSEPPCVLYEVGEVTPHGAAGETGPTCPPRPAHSARSRSRRLLPLLPFPSRGRDLLSARAWGQQERTAPSRWPGRALQAGAPRAAARPWLWPGSQMERREGPAAFSAWCVSASSPSPSLWRSLGVGLSQGRLMKLSCGCRLPSLGACAWSFWGSVPRWAGGSGALMRACSGLGPLRACGAAS